MRLVRLTEAGASGTPLGTFLEALMRGFKPQEFVQVIGRLEHNLALYAKENKWTTNRRDEFLGHFEHLEKLQAEAGMNALAGHVRITIEKIKGFKGKRDADRWIDEMVRIHRFTLVQEMEHLFYFDIPAAQVHYWKDNQPFGAKVAAVFPDAGYDIEQASKCLALDRSTACVFHLMRVLDHALHRLSTTLHNTFDPRTSWDTILNGKDGVKDKIDQMRTNTPELLAKKEDYHRVYGHLNSVKNAWRNPTMHPRKHYDTEEAEDVFCATRGFMRDLAKVI